MAIQTPKLAVPIRLRPDGRGLAVVEQDSYEEVVACVENVLMTPLGWRAEEPRYGLREQAWQENGADLHEIQNTISMWEPRADEILERDPDALMQWVDLIEAIIRDRGEL